MRLAIIVAMGLAAGATGGPDWSRAEPVTVQLSSFKFTPAALVLDHGKPYRLHLVNTASGGHDFSAPQFFAASDIAPADRAKVDKGRIDLDGGEAVDIDVEPLKPGTYRLDCTHFMHAALGMTGSITVR